MSKYSSCLAVIAVYSGLAKIHICSMDQINMQYHSPTYSTSYWWRKKNCSILFDQTLHFLCDLFCLFQKDTMADC